MNAERATIKAMQIMRADTDQAVNQVLRAADRDPCKPRGLGATPCDYHVEEGPVDGCPYCAEINA